MRSTGETVKTWQEKWCTKHAGVTLVALEEDLYKRLKGKNDRERFPLAISKFVVVTR